MTPRLKGLLAAFGISILILVADKVSESRDESTVGFGEKPKRFHRGPKVPKTRMKAARQREQSRKDAETYADSIRLRPIPQTALSINGWYRNPFTSDPIGQHAIGIGITNAPIDEKIALLNNLEQYNVEIITVEHNFVEKKRDLIFDLITLHNYVRVFTNISQWDDWYIKKNNKILLSMMDN